ncbi:small membrane protein [Klebsiella pneumoniae]|nr:small membrane protein [Klebsiella pneumoniae]
MSDFFIILCLILCPVISLWSGFSYIQERRKRRYVSVPEDDCLTE